LFFQRQGARDATELERLVEPTTRGDPQSPLRWTCKSTRQLAKALAKCGYTVSHPTVAELLHELGYSLQANVQTLEGASTRSATNSSVISTGRCNGT